VEFLFGEAYSTKRDENGNRVSVRPEGAMTLDLTPVKTTGARGKAWARVQADGDSDKFNPSTDKEVCGILGLTNDLALRLRDVRLIDQTLKSVFRAPLRDGGALVISEGHRVYKGGIASFIGHDDRIHSFFSQHKETGRASSKRPPLQNLSKRREMDYKRILADAYRYKIRSFMTSNTDPAYGEPTVLVEADYKGAELFGTATQSRDEAMIDHCLRANLPEDHPNFYDIHSNVAVNAFRLDCEPTKSGLASIDKADLRVGAKNVIFGGSYGRSAEAIARQGQEEGVPMTEQDAASILQAIFDMYPGIPQLQEALRMRAKSPSWVCNCFGRYRRVIPTGDRGGMGELERQFLNYPFQSMVADAVSIALYYLHNHPDRERLGYRIVLQVHDAVILEVPTRSLDDVCRVVLPECMEQRVKFRACDLDGSAYPDSPEYNFSIDSEVMLRWGEHIPWSICDELGINREYGFADASPEPTPDPVTVANTFGDRG